MLLITIKPGIRKKYAASAIIIREFVYSITDESFVAIMLVLVVKFLLLFVSAFS
jgi:hypothetical protein